MSGSSLRTSRGRSSPSPPDTAGGHADWRSAQQSPRTCTTPQKLAEARSSRIVQQWAEESVELADTIKSGAEYLNDLPGFFGPMISRKMAPNPRGAHEKESIH
jgi:hypothetical protein